VAVFILKLFLHFCVIFDTQLTSDISMMDEGFFNFDVNACVNSVFLEKAMGGYPGCRRFIITTSNRLDTQKRLEILDTGTLSFSLRINSQFYESEQFCFLTPKIGVNPVNETTKLGS